jgi:hypothetical protein
VLTTLASPTRERCSKGRRATTNRVRLVVLEPRPGAFGSKADVRVGGRPIVGSCQMAAAEAPVM